MVGDTDLDLRAGRTSGIRTCAALYGYGMRSSLLDPKPDFAIEEPGELLTILRNNGSAK
jgi:phosphoglycolate phosphatase-like HAD superfamily hydrolase